MTWSSFSSCSILRQENEELESASNLLKSTQLMSFREDLNAHLLKLDICLPRAVFEKKKKYLPKCEPQETTPKETLHQTQIAATEKDRGYWITYNPFGHLLWLNSPQSEEPTTCKSCSADRIAVCTWINNSSLTSAKSEGWHLSWALIPTGHTIAADSVTLMEFYQCYWSVYSILLPIVLEANFPWLIGIAFLCTQLPLIDYLLMATIALRNTPCVLSYLILKTLET